jgi:hypothetical protein
MEIEVMKQGRWLWMVSARAAQTGLAIEKFPYKFRVLLSWDWAIVLGT